MRRSTGGLNLGLSDDKVFFPLHYNSEGQKKEK